MVIDTVTGHQTQAEDGSATQLSIIDTDVHHGVRDKKLLSPYLPKIYQERLQDYGFGGGGGLYANNGGYQGRRVDAYDPQDPGDTGTQITNVEKCRNQLLDGCGIDLAILTGGSAAGASSMTDLDYASAICRAFNDYTLEHWLARDRRFRFCMCICTQDPSGAVEEIDRIGDQPAIVGIMMPCGAPRPFGHRFYHPIYEACVRHGLTVALHFGGEGGGVNPPPSAAGYASYYAEARQMRPSFYQAHLASYIFEGVFERFPALKVAMLEGGFGWVPTFRWRMDADWKGLRHQTPWVKRLPSEYIFDHVRFGSQPIEDPDRPEALEHIVAWMNGERTLIYSSDYPHWDWDDPAQSFTSLAPALRQRIMVDNARETFNL